MFSRKRNLINSKILIKFEDGSVALEDVVSLEGNALETKYRVLNLENLDRYISVDGYVIYLCNLDFFSKSESESLKKLRRSAVINNLFNFGSSSSKNFDLFKFLPYLIILILIFFN